jgi:hypothetical protein
VAKEKKPRSRRQEEIELGKSIYISKALGQHSTEFEIHPAGGIVQI